MTAPSSTTLPAPSTPKLVKQPWKYLGLKRATYFRMRAADPKFPRPRQVPGLSHPVWLAGDLDRWVSGLAAKR